MNELNISAVDATAMETATTTAQLLRSLGGSLMKCPPIYQPRNLEIYTCFLQKFTLCSWQFSLSHKFNSRFLCRIQTDCSVLGHIFFAIIIMSKSSEMVICSVGILKFPITICRTQNLSDTPKFMRTANRQSTVLRAIILSSGVILKSKHRRVVR